MVNKAHRMGHTIEDLLELSRIELGESPHREVVSLGTVAAEAVERVRHLAERRDITIDVSEPSRRLNAIGDRLSNNCAQGASSISSSTPDRRMETAAERVCPSIRLT